jgi:hypothetical protein
MPESPSFTPDTTEDAVGRADLEGLHRWFGIHLNNEAWEVIDGEAISAHDEASRREEALYRAYASVYHWMQVGSPMNQGRGEHLISRTPVPAGRPDLALAHAARYLELIEAYPNLAEDWDRAFGREALARALAMTAELERARGEKAEAERLCAMIAEEEERAAVETELAKPPWFGI